MTSMLTVARLAKRSTVAGRALGLALAVVAASLVLATSTAVAHPLAPGLLELREFGDGTIEVVWKTPLLQPRGSKLAPALPPGCRALDPPTVRAQGDGVVQRWRMQCDGSVVGASVGMNGLADSKTSTLVRIALSDGRVLTQLLTGERATFEIPERTSAWDVARDYVGLGIEHLLTGLDHVLFVLGLLLLIERRRALLMTVTAFTLGHSVTLSLAALGIVRFPAAPIELAIAASILVLATEAASARTGTPGRLARRPWIMALAFGLLHGLGFAGALASIGLPEGDIPLALLSFNVGIELGQIAVVAMALPIVSALRARSWRGPRWVTEVPAYAIGSLAAFWCFERIAPLVAALTA